MHSASNIVSYQVAFTRPVAFIHVSSLHWALPKLMATLELELSLFLVTMASRFDVALGRLLLTEVISEPQL